MSSFSDDRNRRMSLRDRLNYKLFKQALSTVREHRFNLTEYDSQFFQKLEDAHDAFGNEMQVTVKQFNYLRQLAFELEKGA